MGSVIATPIVVALSFVSTNPSDFITYCKWLYSYCYLTASQLWTKKRFDIYDMEARHDPEKVAFLAPKFEMEIESPQSEHHLLHAADEVFFYGVNSSSECLIVRIARSLNHESEAWIYLKLKDGKVLKLNKTSGYQNSCSDGGREFTCGGLRVHYNSPMRRWRIFYNGLLREISEDEPETGKMVYVKLALLWAASSDTFDLSSDVNNAALALGFAKTKWKSCTPPLKKLNDALNFYAQSGNTFGTVSIEGESSDRNLYLFGEKTRFLGDTLLENGCQFTHVMGQISRNGSIVHIAEATVPGVVKDLRYGFVVLPNGVVAPLSDPHPQFKIGEEKENITALFHAEGLEFQVEGSVAGRLSHFESNKGWDGSLTIDCLGIQMNGHKGNGVLIKGKILKKSIRSLPEICPNKAPADIPLAVHFSEELCEIQDITGGKGSSLGKLTHLSKKFQNFIVPNGMVVTTSAYESFLSKEIRKGIAGLEDVLYGKTSGDIKEVCQRVMDEVIKANIPDAVLQAVVNCLQKTFGEELHTKKFAIRSSATGEDTEQMSAAGQMETFLGITGLSEIMSAVKKCWASQFGFIAVQYKRQNGQIINSPMAVVIQEMVPCDVAGVLFTCDPLTGNPSLMSITANYGLGESVVSGSEEPDTIVLRRDEDDKLEIKDKMIGAKSRRIVIREDEGTSLEDVDENEKKNCCVSDANALRLGNIAVKIEKCYRSNRDIEWGFWNNNLYIFQSRPVTSGTGETDFEIDHETDGALRMEKEYFSMCNVGEVMPGAMSTLGLDVLSKYFAIAFQRKMESEWQNKGQSKYHRKGIVYMLNRAMFYVLDMFEQIHAGKDIVEASMIGLFGRVLDDEEMYELAMERHIVKKKSSINISRNLKLIKHLFTAPSRCRKTHKSYTNYRIPVEKCKDSQQVFDALVYACDDIYEAFVAHMLASQSSSIWNMTILNVLSKARGGLNSEVYRDFAKLLSSISGVESAEVPSAMQSLAYQIGKEVNPEDFKKRDPEDIVQWLKTSSSEAGIKFRNFLKTHGHRCLKEFDIRSITWGEDPKLLVQLLQNLVGTVTEDALNKRAEDFDQMMKSSGLTLKFVQRLLLKYLMLPQCRKMVQTREFSKSLLIRLNDEWRKGYRHLAKVMASEGRIPDEDLMYFMTLEEIKELISTRSPKILSRANHRRRRHPILDKYLFPEIFQGVPKPINDDDTPTVVNEENFKMQGIPVSQGVAKGFVRVAITLEEASHLKPGEILLTYSTDIGWTPYFPSLAGVVTELGGLISHGAVVSREYGLPCIAGLHGATRQFQTGDYVLLDGNRGILQKLAPPQ